MRDWPWTQFLLAVLLAAICFSPMTFAQDDATDQTSSNPDGQFQLIEIQKDFTGETGMKSLVMILFLTIGPLKILPVFIRLTANADEKLRRQIAFRAFWVSTLTIVLVAKLGQTVLMNYRISVTALTTAAALVLGIIALRSVLAQYNPAKKAAEPPAEPTLALAVNPLSFPVILPPYGIAAVLLLMTIGGELGANTNIILGITIGWMIADYLCMLGARQILRVLNPNVLQVVGLVMGIIQLSIAITWFYRSVEIELLSVFAMAGGG